MGLAPEISIPVAAGVGGMVLAIHNMATPPVTDIRSSTPGTMPAASVNSSRRQATWMSFGIVAGISLIAKDTNILVVGGAIAVGMDWWTRYSNEVYPTVGRVLGAAQSAAAAADAAMGPVEPAAGDAGNPYAGAVAV